MGFGVAKSRTWLSDSQFTSTFHLSYDNNAVGSFGSKPQPSFSSWHTCIDLLSPTERTVKQDCHLHGAAHPREPSQWMLWWIHSFVPEVLWWARAALCQFVHTLPSDVLRSFMVKTKCTVRLRGTMQHRWKGAHWGRISPSPILQRFFNVHEGITSPSLWTLLSSTGHFGNKGQLFIMCHFINNNCGHLLSTC